MDRKIPTTIRYVSCPKFTVLIEVDEDTGRIILGPPIVKKFIGKYSWELFDWIAFKFGECQEEFISCSTNKSAGTATNGFGVSGSKHMRTGAGVTSSKF